MSRLGKKHQCIHCNATFFDPGKSDLVCPTCGAEQWTHPEDLAPFVRSLAKAVWIFSGVWVIVATWGIIAGSRATVLVGVISLAVFGLVGLGVYYRKKAAFWVGIVLFGYLSVSPLITTLYTGRIALRGSVIRGVLLLLFFTAVGITYVLKLWAVLRAIKDEENATKGKFP